MLKELDNKVLQWIEKNKAEIINEWLELIRIPSVISEQAESAPYGENCAKALDAVAKLYEKYGIDTKQYKSDGYMLASYGKGEKVIGLFSHSDVVPAGDGWIYTSPFSPIVKDNTIIGRGCEDNKSGIMLSLCMLRIAGELNLPIKSRLLAFAGSNEESGMNDINAFVHNHTMPELSFVPDAEFPCSIGEKGIYHVYATAPCKFEEILSFSGGEAFNLVLDKATVSIKYSEALKSELATKTQNSESFELTSDGTKLIVCAKGVAKHASVPEGSVNAGYLISELLCGCTALCENDKKILSISKDVLKSGFGEGINAQHNDPLFGRLTMVNGIIETKDGKLRLSFDIRYGSSLPAKKIEEMVDEGFAKFGWTTEEPENMEGFSISDDSKIPDMLESIYEEMTGISKKKITMSGGTYARFLKNAFSVGTHTDYNDRSSRQLQMPDGHGGAHEKDEKIDLDEFFFAMRILIQYIVCSDKELNG